MRTKEVNVCIQRQVMEHKQIVLDLVIKNKVYLPYDVLRYVLKTPVKTYNFF